MSQPESFRVADIKRHVRPFGFQLTLDALRARGHTVKQIAPSDKCGTVLMSLYWMEDLYELIRWRKRNGIGSQYRLILGGNHATGYPNTVVSFADAAYCGDGELWDGSSASLVTLTGEARPVAINPVIPPAMIHLENKSTTICPINIVSKINTQRIIKSRGK